MIIYKQKKRTYTQSGPENFLFQFCLTITELFSPFYLEEMKKYWSLNISRAVSQVIMRVHKPKVEFKLLCVYVRVFCLYTRVLALNKKT